MVLKVYNTLTRQKEEFKPERNDEVRMYVCGMTVYAEPHLGHARTYLSFEIIKRYMMYKGFKVKYVQNITDIDDKIIKRANELGVDPLDLAEECSKDCLDVFDKLGVDRADIYPRATLHIPDIIALIKKTIERGFAYENEGDVYFSVKTFKDYGKLSGQKFDQIKQGARIEPSEKKREPEDFALWKAAKPREPSWDSPWGKGRPGWHIECSAMSMHYLGEQFDVHGGGQDLIFPHHENEIAQSEAATGKTPFVKYWLHTGWLTINREKMSKSLGNVILIKDLLKKYDGEVIRFFYAQTHYRSPIDFSNDALDKSRKSLERIKQARKKLGDVLSQSESRSIFDEREAIFLREIDDAVESFERGMDDDFNTSAAIASIFSLINSSNRFLEDAAKPSKEVVEKAYNTLIQLCSILTLFKEKIDRGNEEELKRNLASLFLEFSSENAGNMTVSQMIDILLQIRERERKNRNWEVSDRIRDDLNKIGIVVEDTKKGVSWRRVSE
jgi:cysteinyl-tRNA synthetase